MFRKFWIFRGAAWLLMVERAIYMDEEYRSSFKQAWDHFEALAESFYGVLSPHEAYAEDQSYA